MDATLAMSIADDRSRNERVAYVKTVRGEWYHVCGEVWGSYTVIHRGMYKAISKKQIIETRASRPQNPAFLDGWSCLEL